MGSGSTHLRNSPNGLLTYRVGELSVVQVLNRGKNVKLYLGKIIASAATVAALSVSPVAFGAYGDQGSLKMSNYAYGGMSFSIVSPSHTGGVGAGGFSASYDANFAAAPAAKSFVAYCIDLAQTFSWNSAFTVTETNPSLLFGATKALALGQLYTQHFWEATTASKSAAFQLAVWEIITETSGPYALTGGSFAVTSGDAGTLSTATGWLGSLSGAGDGYKLTALVGPNNQDQMMATPVPEPETYMMLLAGLGLMGFVARRRQRSGAV